MALIKVELGLIDPFGKRVAEPMKFMSLSLHESSPEDCARLEKLYIGGTDPDGKVIFEEVRISGTYGCEAIIEASFDGQLDQPARMQIGIPFPTKTTSTSETPNSSEQLVPIMTAVITTSGILIGAFSAAILHRRRQRKFFSVPISTQLVKMKESAALPSPPKPGKSNEMTIGAATTVSGTTNFMLAIPGYLTLNHNDYMIFEDKVLGTGATAVIFLGVLSPSLSSTFRFDQIALKVYKSDFSDASIKYELALLSSLQYRSKHIVELVGYTETPALTIATRFYENGTLSSKIYNEGFSYPPTFVRDIALGLATGVSEMHKVNVVHFDLKPANILLDSDFSPVISDFGMAKVIDNSRHSVKGLQESDVFGFTPAYCAPELLSSNLVVSETSKKADVYAYGIVLLELITRKKAWRDQSDSVMGFKDICRLVSRGERPLIPDSHRDEFPLLTNIIQQCWQQDPLNRPSSEEISKFL